MKLYSYPSCGTCRKALSWLRDKGILIEPIDITQHPPTYEELEEALEQIGCKRLFNTSGQSYRALGAKAVQAMDDRQALEALAADGKLIKRPFLISDSGKTLTGFKPEEWEAVLRS